MPDSLMIGKLYPHPAPNNWPFPIWKDYPYVAAIIPKKPLGDALF